MKSLSDLGFEVIGEPVQIRLPTFVEVSAKTLKSLNMNVYRNLHHHQLNKQKVNFSSQVAKTLKNWPRLDQIAIHYEVFAPRGGRLDTMNVGSIVDKYFSDTMVETGTIEDDDYRHIVGCSFSFGGISKNDAHAIATVTPVRKKVMRIFLEQTEIRAAVQAYVNEHVDLEITDLDFTTDDDGDLQVELIVGEADPQPDPKSKPKSRGGRPKGSKNKPKPAPVEEVPANADGSSETGGDDGGKGDGGAADTDAAGTKPVEKTKAETTSKPDAKPEGGNSKNLFSGEENGSSKTEPDQPEKTPPAADETGGGDEAPVDEAPKKKISIFDVGS